MEEISPNFKAISDLFSELKKKNFVPPEIAANNEKPESIVEDDEFNTLISHLDQLLTSTSVEDHLYVKYLCMKSSAYYERARILNNAGVTGSEEIIEKALNLIEDQRDHPQAIYLYMRITNLLAFIHLNKGDFENARDLLETISEKYIRTEGILIYSTEDLFTGAKVFENQAKLNKLLANNLQLLGWIYGKLGKSDVQADTHHMALEKQLNIDVSDPINWTYSCLRLITLYLNQERFIQARYHLKACTTIIDHLERTCIEHPDLPQINAELAREWVSYGLQLFNSSRIRLMEQKYPDVFNKKTPANERPTVEEVEPTPFSNLSVDTNLIPVHFVTNTEEARNLFLYTHSWLKRARLYYTLRDFPIHYVNGVLDLSELYRYLAFYEIEIDAQYNVHKKRIEALETLCTVLKDVRPQCYVAVNVELLRELTEVQMEMMSINLRRIQNANNYSDEQSEDILKRQITAVTDLQRKLNGVREVIRSSETLYY